MAQRYIHREALHAPLTLAALRSMCTLCMYVCNVHSSLPHVSLIILSLHFLLLSCAYISSHSSLLTLPSPPHTPLFSHSHSLLTLLSPHTRLSSHSHPLLTLLSPHTPIPSSHSHPLLTLPSLSPFSSSSTIVAETQVVHVWCGLAEASGVHTQEHPHYCDKVHQRDRRQRYVHRCIVGQTLGFFSVLLRLLACVAVAVETCTHPGYRQAMIASCVCLKSVIIMSKFQVRACRNMLKPQPGIILYEFALDHSIIYYIYSLY